MSQLLVQSVAEDFLVFVGSVADRSLGQAGLTLTVTLRKKGESGFSAIAPTVTDCGNGVYSLALTAPMLNTIGPFAIHVTAPGGYVEDVFGQVVLFDFTNLSIAAIADAVADEVITGGAHAVSGSIGEQLQNAYATAIDAATAAQAAYDIIAPNLDMQVSDVYIEAQAARIRVTDVQATLANFDTRIPAALVGGRMSSYVGAIDAAVTPSVASITALQADTDNIQTRLPDALVGGRMDSSVGAMAANVLTAAALAADAVTAIVAGVFAFAIESGQTFKGYIRGMNATFFGKAEGLNGTNPKVYRADGVTVAADYTQDPGPGDRPSVDITNRGD